MRFAWLSLLALAGCPASDDSGDYPIRPGGTGGPVDPGDRPDAGPLPDAAPATMGRVCVTTDPRNWDAGGAQCQAGPLSAGLTVVIGSDMATTTAGGFFTFPMAPTGPRITVTGRNLVPSIRLFTDPDDLDTVALQDVQWTMLQTGAGITVTGGNASLFVELRDNGVKRPGFTADSIPPPGPGANNVTYYDDDSGFFAWNDIETESQSKALFADLTGTAGTVMVTATIDTRMASASFPVEPDSITFGFINVPPP